MDLKFRKTSILFLSVITFFLSCKEEGSNNSVPKRPIEHWVFRSVLDTMPRMITVALDNKLWVAYHTESGSIYKAWKGPVYFDGAVYTGAHGPQPISIGDAYFENKFAQPWFVLGNNGDTINPIYKYKGHRFVNGHAELMHSLNVGKNTFLIYEQLEAASTEGGLPIFQRIFTTSQIPNGYSVGLKFNLSSVIGTSSIETDGKMSNIKTINSTLDDVNYADIEGSLLLKSNAITKYHTTFMPNPMVKNKNVVGGMEEEEENSAGGLHPGLKLIAKSDCKSCHNKNLKTIGPAYVEIAKKYENNAQNISLLTSKVKKGGSGVWGEQVMTAHDDLAEEDIKEMVTYIMSLDNDTESAVETKNNQKKVISLNPSLVKEDDLLPGAVTKIYDIEPNLQKLPSIPASKKPKFAGIMPNFDNISGSSFRELFENFALHANGYFFIEKSGQYTFQIWSDDGSRVYFGDQLVMDNDGVHGVEYKDVTVNCQKGYYPFRIEFFQGGGGNYLAFDWIKPGDKDYEIVPTTNIFHLASENASLSGYSLPMAEGSRVPGDMSPLEDVHPSFDLSTARPGAFKPKVGGIDFKKDGRMIVSTWEETGSVWVIAGHETGDSTKMKHKRIAFGLAEPLGVKVVDDTIYVMQKQEITKLVDTNGDDIIDEYRTLSYGWKVSPNFHEFGFGLAYKDGFFYATLATAIQPGGASTNPQIPDRGKVVKINKITGETSFIASGLRTPNGIGLGMNGEIFVADNQGDWLPSSKIVHVRDGAWFGSRSVDPLGTKDRKEDLPVVWLPQDEIGNSPSTPLGIEIGPWKGQMIHGEVTHGGVKRVFVEKINGQLQGCVFRFIQGLEAGINRIAWGPQGDLYVGGIGNGGNWGQSGKQYYGLEKLHYNGKSTFEMLAIRAKSNGLEIEFTEPISYSAADPKLYEIKQWYYKPTINYGGPKLGEQSLPVKSTTVAPDRKKVFLEIPGIKANHVVYVHLRKHFISQQGQTIWSTEAWYTMNQIPQNDLGTVNPDKYDFAPNTLSPSEMADGWKLLFDGKSLVGWHNYNKKDIGKSWIIQDGAIHLNSIQTPAGWKVEDGGDLVSDKKYKNFEFSCEWKINNCGNSGVFFNVVEDKKYQNTYLTGVEMQVLDNLCHPDSRYNKHRAGDLYDLKESKYNTVRSAGQWNEARIRQVNGKIDFWLNGVNIISAKIGDTEWNKMISLSKFKDWEGFAKTMEGHLALQDHGDKVWYRSIKIKELK